MKRVHTIAMTTLLALALAGTALGQTSGKLVITGHMDPAAKVEVPAGAHAQLSAVDVKEGQAVKKGQQLAKLDDAIQQATVDLAKAAADNTIVIQAQENELASAQNQYDKVKNNSAVNDWERRQKELDLKQAKLKLEQAKEEQRENRIKLEQEQIRLDHMTIRSPIDGYVLRVNKEAGEETDENPLVVVVDTHKLYAVFDMPRLLFGKIHVGDMETVKTEGMTREATVISVDPIIDLASGLFRVKMEVDNADGKIPAGVDVTWEGK
ncbi:MAG TPA: efflux RND transporter periplasmic adaptor subunit [Phycisphaerae bacterium]|nr:efflux RND transporter periplasmic adaptor subunit [Phycisphaerae bacterium]